MIADIVAAALRVLAIVAIVGAVWWVQIWFHDWDMERQRAKKK